MYCENCGSEMKVTDKFCEKCGNKNLKSEIVKPNAEINNETTTPEKHKKPFSFKKLTIPGVVAIILFVVFAFISGNEDNKYISIIKDASPIRYPEATYGEGFDNYFANAEWTTFTTDDKRQIVEFNGKSEFEGSDINVCIQYDVTSGTASISYYEMMNNNDKDISDDSMLLTLYESIFENIYNKKNYALPSKSLSEEYLGQYLAYELIGAFTMSGGADEDQIWIDIFHQFFDPIDISNTSIAVTATVAAVETEETTLAIEDYVDMALAQYAETEPSTDNSIKVNNKTIQSSTPAPVIHELGSIDPDIVIDAIYKSYPDDMTISEFYIEKELNGYILHIEATSSHNPYYQTFKGYCDEIYKNDNAELIFHFVSMESEEDSIADGVLVGWYNWESIDHPVIYGDDETMYYLFNGEYSFEENLAQ